MPDVTLSVNQPAYRRVYSELKLGLKSKYPVGSFLPTEGELEEIYGVSRTTIRKAISLLEEEGLIKVTQGRGTEVIKSFAYERYTNVASISTAVTPDSPTKASNGSVVISQSNISLVTARDKTAEILQVEPGAPLFCIQRIISNQNNAPVALLVDYLSADLVPGLNQYSGKFTDLYSFLADTYNIHYTKSTETITAKSASLLEANTLKVEIGSPLLYCRKTAYCDKGPLEYSYSTYVPDLYQITINMDMQDFALV